MPRAEPPDHRAKARKRWRLLAKALLEDNHPQQQQNQPQHHLTPSLTTTTTTTNPCCYSGVDSDVSVRRFTSFGVLAPKSTHGEWLRYATPDDLRYVYVRQPRLSLTAKDLMGFNNTGNVCVWPSEETLSIYVVDNLESFRGKTVLELGGGMSCMAGLILAKYGRASRVHVTDGNQKSVDNVRAVIEYNELEGTATCSVLQWECAAGCEERYDVILVADCLFFDETREDLIRTMGGRLADGGVAYVMAPQRGDTLDRFVRTSGAFGFSCVKCERYSAAVWERHVELLDTNAFYDPSLHYPILLKMIKV